MTSSLDLAYMHLTPLDTSTTAGYQQCENHMQLITQERVVSQSINTTLNHTTSNTRTGVSNTNVDFMGFYIVI